MGVPDRQEVDVAVTAGAPQDDFEELLGRVPRRLPVWARRAAAALLTLGVGALLVLVAARATVRVPSPVRPVRAAPPLNSPLPSPRSLGPGADVQPDVTTLPSACLRPGASCIVRTPLPAPTVEAVHAVLPDLRYDAIDNVLSAPDLATPTIVFRQLNGHDARVQLLVRVGIARASERDRDARTVRGQRVTLFAAHRVGRYYVQVQIDGPPAAMPASAVVRDLSRDRRLLLAA